jgi:hypothetical protein
MSKDKAMVQETGETHEVKSQYVIEKFTMNLSYEEAKMIITDKNSKVMLVVPPEQIDGFEFVHDSEPLEEGKYYTLDDDKTYHEKDVIVGMEEIRDHKLKNII